MADSTTTPNTAGIVLVEIRADASQFDADIKRIVGKTDALAKGGAGSAVKPAVGAAAAEIADANRGLDDLAAKTKATRQDIAFAGREARRDIREEAARIRDQIGDTSAFSGAGFSDLLFGIDDDRIKLNRLAQTIGDLDGQLARARASFQAGTMSANEFAAAEAKITAQAKPLRDQMGEIEKRWVGIRGAMRGAGATIASSLASSMLIGAGLGIAMTAIQGLIDLGGQIVEKVVDPLKQAREEITGLADDIRSAGGPENYLTAAGLDPKSPLAQFIRDTWANDQGTKSAKSWSDAVSTFGIAGGSIDPAMSGTRKEWIDALMAGVVDTGDPLRDFKKFMGFSPGMMSNYEGLSNQASFDKMVGWARTRAGEQADPGLRDAMLKAIEEAAAETKRNNETDLGADWLDARGNIAASFEQSLLKAFSSPSFVAAQRAFNNNAASGGTQLSADKVAGLQQKIIELLGQKDQMLGNAASAYLTTQQRAVVSAQAALDDLRKQQNDLSTADRNRAINQTLNAAKSDVARAGVATAGMTAFELGAQILEAKQRQREAEAEAARQRKQNDLLDRIATAQETLASAQQAEHLSSIDSQVAELAKQLTPDALAKAMSGVAVVMDGTTVGHLVSGTVASDIAISGRFGTPVGR